MNTTFHQQLTNTASEPYLSAGRFAWYFARGKLNNDAVFTPLLSRGLIPDCKRLLDLGCGQGLLLAWLRSPRILFERVKVFGRSGFSVTTLAMNSSSPYANVILIGRVT